MVSRKQLEKWFGQRIYGLLSQAGAAAPTATIKNQSFLNGLTLTWARTGVGTYTLTGPANSFPIGIIIKGGVYDQASGKALTGVRTSATVLTFTHGVAGGAVSDVFTNVPFEIELFS